MIRIKYFVCLLTILLIAEKVYAQDDDTEIFAGMTWYLKKSVALDSARSQGKQVFLVWGRTTCKNTIRVRQRLAEFPLKSIVDEHYILWFSDSEIYRRFSPELSDYLLVLPPSVTLPAICIIDMFDVKVAHGLKTGPQYSDDLQAMLEQYVSNEYIEGESNVFCKVYVSGNTLVIKNEITDETISIYYITGSLADRFHKTGYDVIRDISKWCKGLFIVTGSSGWAQKIIVR